MSEDIATRLSTINRARARLQQLGEQHIGSLRPFFDDARGGFQRKRSQVGRPERKDISESSTATCILSLTVSDRWRDRSSKSKEQPPWCEREVELADRLLKKPWTSAQLPENNPYSVAWMLEGIASVYAQTTTPPTAAQRDLLKEARNFVIEPLGSEGSIRLRNFPASAYLTQLGLRALRRSASLVGESDFATGVQKKVRDWAKMQLERQIALLATESRLGDVYELAYATILFASTRETGVGLPDDLFLIRSGITRLFELQNGDGSWPRSHPIFVHHEAGNAHCFEFEMLAQFVELRAQRDVLPMLLQQVPGLIKAVGALDAERFELAGGSSGWSSHFYPPEQEPESWSTASAFHFAYSLDRLLSEAARRLIFEDIGTAYPLTALEPLASGIDHLQSELADSALPHPGDSDPEKRRQYSLLEVLWGQFIDPISQQREAVERGHAFDATVPVAAILFGPPGTAKTQLAKMIADYLGWPLLTLDPSNFLRLGLDHVEAEADRIFGMLARADRLVVLLDEFDEMVRARATAEQYESRFLTTSMLPKLTSIRTTRRIVFIVATNHVSHFDVAIGRRGRFDLILQVLPPLASAKFKKKGLSLDLLKDAGVRTEVGQLTWDEFGEIVDSVKQGDEVAKNAIAAQFDRCTMRAAVGTPTENQGGAKSPNGGGETWGALCDRERAQSRFSDRAVKPLFVGPLEPPPA
jgi:hypothetical protein